MRRSLILVVLFVSSSILALAEPEFGRIQSIRPAAARAGEHVTIRGEGFAGPFVCITVGGIPAQLVSATGDRVTFTVPSGVPPGPTTVTATNPGESCWCKRPHKEEEETHDRTEAKEEHDHAEGKDEPNRGKGSDKRDHEEEEKCGNVRSIGFTLLEGVLLSGNADAPALQAIHDQPPSAANETDIQNGIILTRLDIFFAPDATVGDINAVLDRTQGGIVSMLAGSTGLSVAVPRQADFASLRSLAETANLMHGVRLATPGRVKLPQNLFVSTDIPSARHLLPGRVPAAWNAKALLKGCGANRVPVLIPDYYGPPPDGFHTLFPSLGDLADGVPTSITHGYTVIAAMATPGDPSPTAGTNPFLDCLDLRPLQVAALSSIGFQDNLILNFPASGKFLVSMSLGDYGDCEDQGVQVPCTPDLVSIITSPLDRAYHALRWKSLTGPRWNDFLIVAAAGNDRNSGDAGGSIYPGVTLASVENEPAVASQPDPFFTFAADATQWTPSTLFLDLGFESKAASADQMATLGLDVIAFGLDTVVEDNALIVGATTNLEPPAGAAANSPGYDLISEAAFSNSFPDVKTVGVNVPDVCIAVPCHGVNGTSFATPQVAGLASYLWLLSPALRALPASVTRQAILRNTVGGINVSGIMDAYAAVLSLDAAQLPTPASAPVRLALLDVNDDGVFDEQDLAAYVQHYFTTNPDGSMTAVKPTVADLSRFDLNGDGFTGGTNMERFDLDRVGSTQFGQTAYSTATQAIENENFSYDERSVTDLQVLCYYAYSDLYTGSTYARRDLLAQPCGVKVKVTIAPSAATLSAGATQQFSATVTGTNDPRVTWTATGGTIDSTTGIFTASAIPGTYQVTVTSVADPTKSAIATVTVVPSGGPQVTVVFAGAYTRRSSLNWQCGPAGFAFTDPKESQCTDETPESNFVVPAPYAKSCSGASVEVVQDSSSTFGVSMTLPALATGDYFAGLDPYSACTGQNATGGLFYDIIESSANVDLQLTVPQAGIVQLSCTSGCSGNKPVVTAVFRVGGNYLALNDDQGLTGRVVMSPGNILEITAVGNSPSESSAAFGGRVLAISFTPQ